MVAVVDESRKAWMDALTDGSGDFDVSDLWEENSTPVVFEVPLGENEGEAVNVIVDQSDFAHGAIVGRTGIGKSVALETLLCGLGVKYPPEVVELVFASGKGRASRASALPHTRASFDVSVGDGAGEFVDFVKGLVAERQAFAKEHGLALVTPADLPAVFVVAEEVAYVQDAEFMGALALVATCGRALGIHLVVVGQQVSSDVFPAEVVSGFGWVVAFSGFEGGLNVVEPDEGLGEVKPGQGFVLTSSEARDVRVFFLAAGEDDFLQSLGC